MPKLNKNQEKFLIALMEESTVVEACKSAGIGSTTGYKYLNDPMFMKAFQELRRDTLQMATKKLQKSAVKAVEVLEDVMINDENPASSRVQAARAVLDNAYRAYELEETVKRLEELEEYIHENEGTI